MHQKFHSFVSKNWILELYPKEMPPKTSKQNITFLYEFKKKKKKEKPKREKSKSRGSFFYQDL